MLRTRLEHESDKEDEQSVSMGAAEPPFEPHPPASEGEGMEQVAEATSVSGVSLPTSPQELLSQVAAGMMVLPFYMAARMLTLTQENLAAWREQRARLAMQVVTDHTEVLDHLLDAQQAGSAGNENDAARLDQIRQSIDRIGAAASRAIAYCGRTGDADSLKQFKGTISATLKNRAGLLQGVAHQGVPLSDYLARQLSTIVARIDAMLSRLTQPASPVAGAAPAAA